MKPLEFKKILPNYKVLMDNIQEMVLIIDSRGKIVDCNQNAMRELGYEDDIFLLPINEVFGKAIQYNNSKLIVDAQYTIQPAETIAYRKNQTCFRVSLKVMFFRFKGVKLGICTAINITDKMEAIREARYLVNELRNLDELNNELIANVTHELRTPINGIMGFGNSLMESGLKPEQLEDLKIIMRCCSNMNTIVGNILDYTKLANSKLELEQREFRFKDFINHIIEVNSIQINEKGLKLLVNISKEIPEVIIGDELRVSQVLNNLFSNAIKFTSVGHIGLEVTKTYEENHFVELFFMLIDTGIGIGQEDKDKLFKSFSQVDSSITRLYGGTGLGLSISKRLVEAMGGSIQVESEKDKGSIFSFSIRLGLPQAFNETVNNHNRYYDINAQEYKPDTDNSMNASNESDLDYINMRLKEFYVEKNQKPYHKDSLKNVTKNINVILEKLIICIEMENWDIAEQLVTNVRKLIPQEQVDLSKKVLSLLLNVRKQNREKSLQLLKELKDMKDNIFKEV